MSASSSVTPAAAPALSPEEIALIEEYEKIAKFAEDVLAGRHPRVKIDVGIDGVSTSKHHCVPNHLKLLLANDNLEQMHPQNLSTNVTSAPANSAPNISAPHISAPNVAPPPTTKVNFQVNHYKALGVYPNVSWTGLKNAYDMKSMYFLSKC